MLLPRSLAVASRSFTDVERRLRKAFVPRRPDSEAPQARFGSIAAATLLDQAKRLDRRASLFV